jgi:hypothetical protein
MAIFPVVPPHGAPFEALSHLPRWGVEEVLLFIHVRNRRMEEVRWAEKVGS